MHKYTTVTQVGTEKSACQEVSEKRKTHPQYFSHVSSRVLVNARKGKPVTLFAYIVTVVFKLSYNHCAPVSKSMIDNAHYAAD